MVAVCLLPLIFSKGWWLCIVDPFACKHLSLCLTPLSLVVPQDLLWYRH